MIIFRYHTFKQTNAWDEKQLMLRSMTLRTYHTYHTQPCHGLMVKSPFGPHSPDSQTAPTFSAPWLCPESFLFFPHLKDVAKARKSWIYYSFSRINDPWMTFVHRLGSFMAQLPSFSMGISPWGYILGAYPLT